MLANIRNRLIKRIAAEAAEKSTTAEFAEWAMNAERHAKDPRYVRRFIESIGVETREPVSKRPGPRFRDGDMVEIKAANHKDLSTVGPYTQYDKKIGVVTDVDGFDALVQFKGEPVPIRFPGALSPRGVGIYKYTPPIEIKSPKIEIVYIGGSVGKASPEQKIVVNDYINRGLTGERSVFYYSGYPAMASTGSKGWYFKMAPQQRVDLSSEAGNKWRAFNPSQGEIFYIGKVGKRPPGWESILEVVRERAQAEEGEISAIAKKAALPSKVIPIRPGVKPPKLPPKPKKPLPGALAQNLYEVSLLAALTLEDPMYVELLKAIKKPKVTTRPLNEVLESLHEYSPLTPRQRMYTMYVWSSSPRGALQQAQIEKRKTMHPDTVILKDPPPKESHDLGITEIKKRRRFASNNVVFVKIAGKIRAL